MTKSNSIEAMTKIVEALTPLPSEERVRAIKAAMVLLGEEALAPTKPAGDVSEEEAGGTLNAISPRARVWMRQNSISDTELEQVFHVAGDGFDVIASHIPGKSKKEQTFNAYILTGVGQLLVTGTPSFQDKPARALCERSGCYDSANHSAHLKHKGNEFTGTKDKGWTLTAPGLKRGASVIRGLNQQSHD